MAVGTVCIEVSTLLLSTVLIAVKVSPECCDLAQGTQGMTTGNSIAPTLWN